MRDLGESPATAVVPVFRRVQFGAKAVDLESGRRSTVFRSKRCTPRRRESGAQAPAERIIRSTQEARPGAALQHHADQALPHWQEQLNATHRRTRARVEHALTSVKTWQILRDYRSAARTLADTASGIAHLRNLALNG